MDTPQNVPNGQLQKLPKTVEFLITPQQQAWVDYNALGGLITDITDERLDKDGNPITMRKMSATEFAEMIGVDRKTLRRWRADIPNFWGLVNSRRQELAPQSRLQKVHEVWYLSALNPKNTRDRELWLANFDPDFKMPNQKIEHEIGDNYANLLAIAARDGIIEGEVVNEPKQIDPIASAGDQQTHTQTS